MATPSSVHDLKTLICSYHPIIVIGTAEEERVGSLLSAAARELRMQLFEWSITTRSRGASGPPPFRSP